LRRTMFFRLMVMFTALILLCVLLLLVVFALSSREAQINARMETLKSQAYDIAYLAAAATAQPLYPLISAGEGAIRQMMAQKLRSVYEEFQAYCLVVDRSGRITGYFSSLLSENQELARKLDARFIVSTLYQVLNGEEVFTQTQGEDGPMFTVAVPWVQDDQVLGAVYIQTAAQYVQASYTGLWRQAAAAAIAAFLAAAAIAAYYTRRLVKPLEHIARSAGLMAKGLPVPPVNDGGAAELNELSLSFNRMARQIGETEAGRQAFIANLSHELRSPMTSIQGFIQGILDGTIKEEDSRQTLSIVLEETRRLGHLVSGLLTLSRAEMTQRQIDKTPFNLCELARLVVITKLSMIEEKNIEMCTDFQREEMYALGARDQIEQVLINLMDNAIRFTPSRGSISITIRDLDRKTLAVTVRDNGIGVLPADRGRIFERFYTGDAAHTSGEGVGLGLAICKTIMEGHRQTIRLLEDEEPGAAFQFTLEKAEKPEGKPHEN
jgi:signal transduction histidine kinase